MNGQIHIKSHDDTMLEHMPVGVALFDAQDLRLLAANTLFHTFIDSFFDPSWRNGRAIGHSITEYLPQAEETGVAAIFRRVAETGIPYRAGEFAFSGFESGITYWNWTLDPIQDSDGRTVQLIQTTSEVTAQVLANQEAERIRATLSQSKWLRAVLDQLPEGILITEASNGCISYANAAAANILGIPVTSLTGIPLNRHPQILTLIHDALPAYRTRFGMNNDLQAAYKENNHPIFPWHFAVIQALGGKTISSQEAMVVRPDGRKVITLSSSAPLRTEEGSITGAVIVFQDITDQKSIEQQKNEFLSIASHELRTPITAIQGFAEILQMNATQGQKLSPQSLRALTFISEQSESLTHLIEELLDLTRIENAQLLLNLAPHDLISTIKHVTETQATAHTSHNLQLVLEGLQDTLIGVFDENRIVQVLNNLIGNAIKYSPAGSRIEVGLRYSPATPHEALIWVKDYGIGIAANELSDIFKRFHRANKLDHSISGLGIGLYLVQEVITRHHGRVWVESTEGKGSTFYVRLPLNGKQQG